MVLAWNTCGLLTQHRISLSPTHCCRYVQLFSGLFTSLATWSRGKGMKEKEEPSPEQWEGRLQAGRGVCGLGRDGGSWEVAMRGLLHVLPLLVSLLSQQNCLGFHQGFVAALYFTPLFCLSFLKGAIAGPFPKTVRGLEYVPLSPTLAPRSSHISNRKHSIATCIFLRNLW